MKVPSLIKVAGFAEAELTVEDLARAWASMDGKTDRFDAGRDGKDQDYLDGTYAGYTVEMHEIIRRANRYARIRITGEAK